MDIKKVLLVPWLILIITACSPAESPPPVTPLPASTFTSTATTAVTPQIASPVQTETPEATIKPSQQTVEARTDMIYHVVQSGETIRGIAEHYNLSVNSIIFSNFEVLPQILAPGMTLIIPPIDGFYYVLKDGDALPEVSHRFGVSIISILSWPENGLDQEIEDIEPGKMIFIPGGTNPNFNWSTPTPPPETVPPSP
jgi:LysM repeat protein